ncbi:MAG: exosortase O [Cyanobacteria bacterium SBLK]|nr:exosortase O [Cyanobacteria bacterium SBLK]
MENHPKMEARKSAIALSCSTLVAVWFVVHFSTLGWFYTAFRHTSPILQFVMLGMGMSLLISIGISCYRERETLSFIPTPRIFPLVISIVSLFGAIALKVLGNIEQLTALLFLLGTYGILGLFIESNRWKQGLPIAAIVACILPLSPPLGSGFGGLPSRVLTAHWVEQFLTFSRISAIASHDIIILENGIAEVDIPCSGIKSLWVGTLFFLGLTWLDRRAIGLRWMFVGITNIALLFSANLLRVLILVVVADVFKQPDFAELLHLPLGLFSFILVCGITWGLSRLIPRNRQPSISHQRPSETLERLVLSSAEVRRNEPAEESPVTRDNPNQSKSPQSIVTENKLIQKGVLGIAIALAIVYHFTPVYSPELIQAIALPKSVDSELIELTPAEQRFFKSYPETLAEKHQFHFGDLSGSILVVANTSWRSYHPPELCFIGSGLKVDRVEKKQLSSEVMARWLSLQNEHLSATYWLQSKGQTTDDFYHRLWQQFLTAKDRSWVLVSILFDRQIDSENPILQELIAEIYHSLDSSSLT